MTAADSEPGQVATKDRERPGTPVAVLIAAVILILMTLSYFARGILVLFSLDVPARDSRTHGSRWSSMRTLLGSAATGGSGALRARPISGENAPAGPMYNRDGSPRQSWYDALAFAGLDEEPPPPGAMRFNRATEAWGAVSLSVILFGIVVIIVCARGYVWAGLLVLVAAFVVIESIILLTGHFWLWIIIVLLVGLGLFLLMQKVGELRR